MRKAILAVLLLTAGCAGELGEDGTVTVGDVGDEDALTGADEAVVFAAAATAPLATGSQARVCQTGGSGLRQRSGPSTDSAILRTMPDGTTVKIVEPSSGWYKNDWGGRVGWSHGGYLCAVAGGTQPGDTTGGSTGGTTGGSTGGATGGSGFDAPTTRDGAIQIARAGVGFSYWWGGGRFAQGATHGACYGSCPSCSHSGNYGGDCSGYAAKVWKLPEAMPMDANKHPFSTSSFVNGSTHWGRVSRGNVVRADALTYNSGGAGHIFIYEKDDPWGSMWAFEARGCSYGVVHNVRTAGSAYLAIRRDGF